MKKDSYHYEKLNEQLEHMDNRAMDRLRQNLRDSYIQMKDLSNRCLIDLSNTEKNDKRIFYFKPESILLNDPEQQRQYREQVVKLLSSSPKIKDKPSFSEELNQEAIDAVQDLSEPEDVRRMLSQFFQRRMYNLQQKKYKMLLRWAHFALTSEYLDRIGHHGTFTYGRLQYELENSIKRYERLTQDDDYEQTRDGQRARPRTKGTDEEISTSMYTETPRKVNSQIVIIQDPLSCIRMDDFEIYLRTSTYELKLFRTIEKFVSRLKWLPVAKSLDIMKEAHVMLQKDSEVMFNEGKAFEQKIRKRFDQSNMRKTDDLIVQMEEILQLHYPCNYTPSITYTSKAPIRITNIMDLQVRIIDRAAEFKIFGDIELDEGHSFTYQVNIFFTTYFQRQIVKSQFSYYDQTVRDMKDAYESNEVPDEETGDINEIQRRNLKSLLLIDFQMIDFFNSNHDQNNLFLLKKGKKIIEQIPELKKNFNDIIIVRLKKAHWLDSVMLQPRVDEQQRQQNAYFSYDYAPDLLFQAIQDFHDINDIATINTVYSDITQMYQALAQNQENSLDEIDKIIKTSLVTDQQAKNILVHFKNALKLNSQENDHSTRPGNEPKTMVLSKNSLLRILPRHYIQSLYTLRHMKTRDTKTKLLYVLNFFRAVQKRVTLDLREFAGREIVSENVDLKAPQEATYTGKNAQTISGNINYNIKTTIDDSNEKFDLSAQKTQRSKDLEEGQYAEEDKTNLVDLKKWKYNSNFHTQMLSTCPIIPTFHTKHGEPLEDKGMQPDFTDSKSTSKTHITKKSSQLLTRMDTFHIDEESKEIFVIDDYGMHIMYDCSLDDMMHLDKELLKIGTYFLRKVETSFDFKSFKFPLIDRFQLLEDLVECEFDYQYAKSKVILAYLDVFEHICDPLEQERIIQIITDLMSQRPRLDYQTSEYFLESYKAEVRCLQTHLKLIREIIDYQMKNEKSENHHIKEYLQMTYKIANEYVNKQWSDQNQEDIQKQVKTRQVIQGGMRYQDLQEMQEQAKQEQEMEAPADGKPRESNVDQFAEILGLKNMTVEKMMKQHAKSDEQVDDIMNQDANFIKTQEGYPIFLKENNDQLSKVKFSNFSNEIGVLDFYESLTAIPKAYSAITQVFKEVVDNCLPANSLQLVAMHTVYLEKCYVEFKKCVAYNQDELIEYKGSQYIENDLIMSSPDKIMFLIKDMVAHLARTYKKSLNPFFVSKLDFYTVHHFQFPDVLKDTMISNRLQRLDVNFTRNFVETQLASRGAQARFFPKLREDDRKVNVPAMLLIFCNLVEVIRLREIMIVNLSESTVLQDIFSQYRDIVSRNNHKILFQNPLNFETFTTAQEQINFIEDGSLTEIDIDLAINEYDPNLRSNLNFMNSESFQCLVLDNGLAELRAAVHYQIMHKQILTVAVRTNQAMMDNFRKALVEVDLLQQYKIKLDNPIIDYSNLVRMNGYLNEEAINSMRSRYISLLSQDCGDLFVPIIGIKQQLRTTVERKFKQTLAMLGNLKEHYLDIESQILQLPPYSVARLMRDYKMSLLHCYCTSINKLNLIEAMRYESIDHAGQLKRLMNVLPKEIGLYKTQSSEFKDAFYQNQYYDRQSDFEDYSYFNNFDAGEIHSYLTIPSLKTVLNMHPFIKDEKASYEKSLFELEHLDFNMEVFKKNLLEEIKLKHKQRLLVKSLVKKQSSFPQEACESTVIGRVTALLKLMLEMFEMHYFFSKVNSHPLESLQLDIAAESMLPFWAQQDTELEDQLIMEIEDEMLSEKIMKKLIMQQKQKHNLNDELEQFGKTIRGVFIRMMSHIGASSLVESIEYLTKYNQQLHYKLTAGLLTMIDNFYLKNKAEKPLSIAHWGFREMTNIDLVAPVFQNGTVLHFKNIDVEQRDLSFGIKNDPKCFGLTIKALRGEKEMIDPSLLLLEDLFVQQMTFTERGSRTGHQSTRKYQFLNTMILGLEREEIGYLSSIFQQIEQNVKDLLEMDKIVNDTSVYSLQKKGLYFQDVVRSKLLQFVLIIMISGKTLTLNSKIYNSKQNAAYKQEMQWKIEYEYEKKCNKLLYKPQGPGQQSETGTAYKRQQHNQINDERVVRAAGQVQDKVMQQSMVVEMHKAVSKEMQERQIKFNHLMMKSIIKMSQRELERRIIKLAIEVISKQYNAMSKCIEMCSKNIDKHLEPMQNFAACCFDHLSKHSHLEPINRVSMIQVLLTRMRNRGMDIETLTSGPGIVFTYKDLNECLHAFCSDIISYSEKEMRTRTQGFQQMVEHQKNLIYIKDTRIDGMKRKMKLVYENITRIVNSRIYEKGNALIFELDRCLREVRFYEDHIFVFEKEMKEFIREEFRTMLQRKDIAMDLHKKAVHDMQNQIVQDVKSHVLNEQKRIKKQIKQASRKMRDLDNFNPPKKSFLQKLNDKGNPRDEYLQSRQNDHEVNQNEWVISPEQAQQEMMDMSKLLSQQRTFWKLKFETQKSKYEEEITILKTKLTSNQALWEQLQESDKRTKILQQELIFTQKSLSQCEKIIEKLKEELKMSEQERIRLYQYKQNKAARLEELEYQVKKIDISEHINITKMIDIITTKDKELSSLKQTEKHFQERLTKVQDLGQRKQGEWQKKYEKELDMKQQVMTKLTKIKEEMGIEGGSTYEQKEMLQNWKVKCKELLDICQGLANENSDLLSKVKDKQENDKTVNLKSADNIAKSRNLQTESHMDNLFASANSLQYNLPQIKAVNTSLTTPQIQYQTNSTLTQGATLSNMLLGTKRFNDSSPQQKSEYSEYSYFNDQGSLSNITQILPIKQIQQPQNHTNRQMQVKNAYYNKNRMYQKRNISNYTLNSSMYENGQQSTSVSAYNQSSERNNTGQKMQRELSLPKDIYNSSRQEKNGTTYAEDFLLKGQKLRK